MAKTRHAKHRRPGHPKTSLSAPEKYRLLITYPGQTRTRQFTTSDLAQARAITRRNTRAGAHVTFQHHEGWGRYTTTNTYAPEPR
ncbi:hypothetical protein [Streptomyces rubiginosohelvolus]|uniref:Integrase n=1 Tax=Streptomyces rubiginosohelvolus TaxID=67362 RepID=A0ABQ3CFI9_9ACTN|nr:hypothetical protein [Streptomyces pluricolorescens]GGZ83963.1 hypothetical protein GCM10010328_67600 [Streptomyces pluricolorescens]